MEFINVDIKDKERVAVVTMNYKKENRFHPAFLAEMEQVLNDLEKDDSVGALVFTGGDPKFFSNGLDVEYMMMSAGDPSKVAEYLADVVKAFKRMLLYPKPTVAALNGHTFGGGFILAASMDFRFMREDSGWACIPAVNLNYPLLPGMIAICQAVMTPGAFLQFYYTGGKFSGPQCKEMGFVQNAHAEQDLIPACVEYATMLAKKKTCTYSEMKRRIREHIAVILDEEDPAQISAMMNFSTSE